MKYLINTASEFGICNAEESLISFLADKEASDAFFELSFDFPEWEDDCYTFMPACVYDGNRLKRVIRKYPPMYFPEESGADREALMTNVPALNPDGSGEIQVTSGDMATPCVGIFNRHKKQGFLVFTRQAIKEKNLGFTLKKGKLTISYPSRRTDIYRSCSPHETSGDPGIDIQNGEKLFSEYRIFTFTCDDIGCFFKYYFELRQSVLKDERASFGYTKELWDVMENHFNECNFSGEYYAEMSKIWQCGWVGGGMSTYPLLMHGTALSRERAIKTIDYMISHQAKSGFFYGLIKDSIILDDSFSTNGMEGLHLVRKSADALYFMFKNFTAIKPKDSWLESARKCAEAFVKLFDTYGKTGQFVNAETGELIIGSTTSAAIVSAALAKAGVFFNEERFLRSARDILEYHWSLFEKSGVTNGGPGEILGAPDSESAFGLLESCIVLYEIDKNEKWLSYAETAAHYCSSWVVSYTYDFPKHSEFYRLGINTVGSVFANVQNKHSAPGICTLSGDSLLKLYRYTKNTAYLDLIKDISYFIPQCVSREEAPIYSWDSPPQKLPAGYICERVNMSDWESEKCVGGVFCFSCWPETSLILSFTELMTQKEMLPDR